MTSRPADVRFLLSRPPRTIATAEPQRALEQAMDRAGLALVADELPADLLIVSGSAATADHRTAEAVVVSGRSAVRAWHDPGRHVDRYVVKQGADGPVLAALATPQVLHYLATDFSRPTTVRGRLRNRALAGRLGPKAANLAVVQPAAGLPYPLATGLPEDVRDSVTGWLFSFREGDELQRIVALVFCDGRAVPTYAVKFGRLPGGPSRTPVEQEVLDELARTAPDAAARATEIVHRGTLGGSELTVERAAVGSVLSAYLQRTPTGRAMALTDRILAWLADVGRSTATSGRSPTMLAALPPADATPLAERLAGVPTVVAHQDLGSWNILTDGREFTVVDWESSTAAGLPLTDACYFCTDVLVELFGPRASAERPAWCIDLWAGRLAPSLFLRRWLEREADGQQIWHGLIGPLATASWLHHGQSQQRRAGLLADGSAGAGYLGLLAGRWREDPALGVDWPGFSAWGT